jgi:hypothetical protein
MLMRQVSTSISNARFHSHRLLSPRTIDLHRWGLSKSVVALLRQDPDLLSRLNLARHQRAFSPKYRPTAIEIFHDDRCLIRSIEGQIIYSQVLPEKSIPTLVEVRFDGEIAMFLVNYELVVDRTIHTLPLVSLLGIDRPNLALNWNTNL